MKNIHLIAVLLMTCMILPANAQVKKRAMTFDELAGWKRITERAISDDGKWAACKMEPWQGNASVFVFNAKGEEVAFFEPAEKAAFSFSSRYLLATLKPRLEIVEELKLKKTKEENMPMNQLLILRLADGEREVIDSLKAYKLAENADWIAYQQGSKKDSALYIRSLYNPEVVSFPAVTAYQFAKEKNVLWYVTKGDTLGIKAGLYTYLPEKAESHLIYEGEGVFKNITCNKAGNRLAFLYCADKDSTATNFSLYVSKNNKTGDLIVERNQEALPEKWIISEHGDMRFSDNSERLFFGIAPEPKQKDTTILDENRPKVQIWNWDEKTQYTQQTYNKEKDLKKTYQAVWSLTHTKFIPLADPELPDLITGDKGNAPVALLTTSEPYGLERMWTGRSRYDVYTVDLNSGEKALIKEALSGQPRLSPKGKYAYWYCWADSSWYTYSIADKKEYRLTTPASFVAWDEDNDMPDYPPAYGIAGWTKDDNQILIYDRYDICQFDPQGGGQSSPHEIKNGRKNNIRYRYIQTDKEETYINTDKMQLLSGFNEKTKETGYYSIRLHSPNTLKPLLTGNFMLKEPLKSKKSEAILYTKETFEEYPDLYLSDIHFKKSIRLTNGRKQQKDIRWGKAELISWISFDGKQMQGVVYKPEDFNPSIKYPLMVNFYERNAETLYSYRMPEPHRSTIDYHFYNSHDYIIFNPDVTYGTGYPGEDCINSVMPGISKLISEGYINEKAIGAQGHSWGGYQVAYLATRTKLFAAIESGAPVVNMFSAYGGIRWGSGLNRSFQYEHTQSRIGATIWEKPLRYVENSPLFTMDKVETPILIMHNDNDGHVPWYQGIEYFVALKRLQKPVWLLNYTGEIHWPMKMANRIDFQKRMFQFFEHYLNSQPMPQWMSEGVKAVDQDFELGY